MTSPHNQVDNRQQHIQQQRAGRESTQARINVLIVIGRKAQIEREQPFGNALPHSFRSGIGQRIAKRVIIGVDGIIPGSFLTGDTHRPVEQVGNDHDVFTTRIEMSDRQLFQFIAGIGQHIKVMRLVRKKSIAPAVRKLGNENIGDPDAVRQIDPAHIRTSPQLLEVIQAAFPVQQHIPLVILFTRGRVTRHAGGRKFESFGLERTGEKVAFPFYLRIPSWTQKAEVRVNGKKVSAAPVAGKYLCINREWANGDRVELTLPMSLSMRTWQVNKNSVSVDYGPLTLSLKIAEKYVEKDSRETAIGDSKWQKGADPQKWPTTEIYPDSPWNYSLVLDKKEPLKNFKVIRKSWPADNYPFTVASVPLEVKAIGRPVPEWKIDETGLCGVLPEEDAVKGDKEEITLIPMGAARLRISAFPNTKE